MISHDPDTWHVNKSGNLCKLHSRIHSKFAKWGGSKSLIRHDSSMNRLWVTVKLPNHYCECGKRIKIGKSYCMPCSVRRTKALRPFYEDYQIREITVLTQDFEHVYRMFKYMGKRDKLMVHHLDCHLKRCDHLRWFLSRNRNTLSKYSSKVVGTRTEIVKLIR